MVQCLSSVVASKIILNCRRFMYNWYRVLLTSHVLLRLSEQAEGTKSSSNTGAEVDTSKSKGTNSSSNTGDAERSGCLAKWWILLSTIECPEASNAGNQLLIVRLQL